MKTNQKKLFKIWMILVLAVIATVNTQNAKGQTYCTSAATSTAYGDITNVTFGTLNNSSVCGALAPGCGSIASCYSNYKSGVCAPTPPNVAQGQVVTFVVTVTCSGVGIWHTTRIFIDYNQNGSFADPDEQVTLGSTTNSPYMAMSDNITIPSTAKLGFTTMRVINADNLTSTCGTYTYGETEDYLINITSNTASSTTSNTTNTCAATNTIPKLTGTNTFGCSQIFDNGNVGIGTTTPGEKLSVAGNASINNTNTSLSDLKILSANPLYGNMEIHAPVPNGDIKWDGGSDAIVAINNTGSTVTGGTWFQASGNPLMAVQNNGNVGIGTTNPTQKLHVDNGAIMVSGMNPFGGPMILFSDDLNIKPNGRWGIEYDPSAGGLNFWNPYNQPPFSNPTVNYNMFLKDNGNIGINNSTPGNKLEITSNSISPTPSGLRFTNLTSSSASVTPVTPNVLSVDANGDVILVPPCCSNPGNNFWSRNATTSTIYPTNTTSLGDKLALGTSSVLTSNPNLYPGGFNARLKLNGGDLVIQEDLSNNVGSPDEGADVFLIDKNGNGLDLGAQNDNAELVAFGANTSINFSTPGAYHGMIMHGDGTNKGKVQIGNVTTPGNYLLYVEKGILAEKVKVALKGSVSWADHVFNDSYKLKPLDEVEAFIKENNHLPGIQSADELVKEGLDLGEMQAKQMEKIEELTLYMIEMKKENEILKNEVSVLKLSISNIKN